MWKKLKGSQLNGFKFRRQYGVDYFIVDFYCPKLRLAIELDGDSHDSVVVQHYDRQRQVVIEKKDTTFLRFSNDEVYGNLEGVVEMISDTANKLSERQ